MTLVTALLDIGRGGSATRLSAEQQRPFDDYLHHFQRLLGIDAPLVVFTSPDLEATVWRTRRDGDTRVHRLTPASLERSFDRFDAVQHIRGDATWRNQASWLAGSPQACLAHYNPLVMSKLAMLDRVAQSNPFNSRLFLWIDAGITRTCGAYATCAAWANELAATLQGFLICTYPYEHAEEIHGFARRAMAERAATDSVRWVARGGLFGGDRAAIARVKARYDVELRETLDAGLMGTEESVLTIVAHRAPEYFHREELSADGLLRPVFERLLSRSADRDPIGAEPLEPSPPPTLAMPSHAPTRHPLSVYILTFNSPAQLAGLLDSWHDELHAYAGDIALHVLDNSTDADLALQNRVHCQRYGGTYLARGNLGISGGRQFIAEHFHASGAPTMLFLEDDMLLSPSEGQCRKGMPTRVDRLLPRAKAILDRERLDFLKLSFTEYHGSNDQQWAWHNVSDERRALLWPGFPRRSAGLALDDIPPTRFDFTGDLDGLRYAVGEVFYCNWPQLVSRDGNRRMFLETRFDKPNESTWMAHLYECSRRRQLRSGVLMASPIEHRREHHYAASERLES